MKNSLFKESSLKELAEFLVNYALKKGADEVEVTLTETSEFTVDVRWGNVENLIEAKSRQVGLRVIKDKKTAFASSSDLAPETLKRLASNALERALFSNSDEFAGLPPPSKVEFDLEALRLYDPEIPRLETQQKIKIAEETEKIALSDKRITNSHGSTFETREAKTILANSNGFLHGYKETLCSLSLALQAGETDKRVEDSWSSTKRHFKELESPEEVAQKAVQRTVRQLNPRKIPTQRVPVVFEPTMTSWLLGFIFSCVSGVAIYQKASFLEGRLGERIANPAITIFDDGLLPGKLGTRPFDSEGVPSQKTVIIEKGVLKNYLCNTYAARKLNLRSTGNAEGPGVSPNNFYLQPGETPPQEIIRSLEKGLILIRCLGLGLNPLTGDISRGAFGLWVEKGEILYPVSEITISGNLGQILEDIEIIGNDLEFRSIFSGPTIKVRELILAGY